MSKVRYEGSDQFRPVSAWGYVGYSILFAIPIIGQLLLIIFAISRKNINRRNYARSFLCVFLIVLLISLALGLLSFFKVGNVAEFVKKNVPLLKNPIEWVENISNHSASRSVSTTTKSTAASPSSSTASAPASSGNTQSSTATSNTAVSSSTGTAGVRPAVKEAIDGYVDFFEEYAAFMKKYLKSSNPLGMMNDYTKMLSKYQDMAEKWDRFDKDYDLNDAELAYYLDACTKIEKLLLGVL